MKEIIVIMDQDPTYSKKFCNQAIKLYGGKYIFLSFQNVKRLKEYAKENRIEAIILSDEISEYIDDIDVNEIYILNEKSKRTRKEGKKTYVYKLQNVKSILTFLENDIDKKKDKKSTINDRRTKTVLFYTPFNIKNKLEIIMKISKILNKKKRVLIVDIDEFSNYKGSVGLSNIIYEYKESKLNIESIKREIVCDKEQDFVRSVTYPEDFSVINSIDLANIVSEIKNLNYDYIFINADSSFIKCQYIANDTDRFVLISEKNNERINVFKKYIINEKQMDIKKIAEFDSAKIDKAYINTFVKENLEIDE